MKKIVIPLMLLLLMGCDSASNRGEIVYVNPETRTIDFKTVTFKHLDDPDTLKNRFFNFKTGVEMHLDYATGSTGAINTVGDLMDVMMADSGNDPSFRYFTEDDVIIPYSVKDSILLTLYYNLEQGILFFNELGMDQMSGVMGEGYQKMPIYFELTLKAVAGGIEPREIKDNAMFISPWNALGFMRQDQFKYLALVMNPMVIHHELSHAIFAYLAEGRPLREDPISILEDPPGTECDQFNAKAINEGFSDYWAAVFVNDPDMMKLSVDEEQMKVSINKHNDRSLANSRTLEASIAPQDEYDCKSGDISPYWGGTIWASALWEIYQKQEITNFNRHLLSSYSCIATKFKGLNELDTTFFMSAPGNCLVTQLKGEGVATEQINMVCSILKKRYPDDTLSGGFNACN